jgi:Raf kinase inhibitor-like YbhB/YbcL family protein
LKLTSTSWANGERIPSRYAAGRLAPQGGVTHSENLNPHLAWSELPTGTRSLVLVCHDFDVPSAAVDVNQDDREVPADLARVDFFHWLLVDLPPTPSEIAEGEYSSAFVPGGKPGPQAFRGARQGLNSFTNWFASQPGMAGNYFGYDGPLPPFNDSLIHHYVFTLYAVSVARLAVEGHFCGEDVRAALASVTLDAATHSGIYTLNRRLLAV